MSTYRFKCLCGVTSEEFGSRVAMKSWHAEHKREACAVRRSGPTGVDEPIAHGSHKASAPVGRERIVAELVELRAHARTFEPIVLPDDVVPAQRMPASKASGCLRSSIAYLLSRDIAAIPDDHDLAGNPLWLTAYNERLSRIGYRLEEITADRGLASHRWIAVVVDGEVDHAVAATRQFILSDSNGMQGGLPIARLKYGLALVAIRRDVPVRIPRNARFVTGFRNTRFV